MFKIYQMNYRDISPKKGEETTLEEAKKMASKIFNDSNGEYPVFIADDKGKICAVIS